MRRSSDSRLRAPRGVSQAFPTHPVRVAACLQAPCCGMNAKWWSCVLALLCMPAEVTLNTGTASQSPLSISNVWINSSLEIKCATSLPDPVGLSLKRLFLGNEQILYLHFTNGVVTKNTMLDKFQNRITITKEQQDPGASHMFKLKLSRLGKEDTDLYYCSWAYIDEKFNHCDLKSNGSVVIVREAGPPKECSVRTVDMTLICLSIVALIGVFLTIVGLFVRCRRFKKNFQPFRGYAPPLPPRPSRPPRTPGPKQPRNIYTQQQQQQQHQQQQQQQHTANHRPYMMASTKTYGNFGNL